MKKRPLIFLLFALFLCGASVIYAQPPTATLTGVIADPTGALVRGATVTATSKATNLSRTATTNDQGIYIISNLPVGEYKVKTEARGFQLLEADVVLNVGQTMSLNLYLEVGRGVGDVERVTVYGDGVDT